MTWRERSPALGKGGYRGGSAKRSRCYSRISSAFSSSTAYVCEAQMVRVTSSSSQPPSRTFERWLNCSRCPARGPHRRGQIARLAPLHRITASVFQQNPFKNGHRQCGYWSRSRRKCPLAIAPRQFTCRSFLHLQGGAIEGRHHGLHQPILGNIGVRTFVWFGEEGSRSNPVRRKRTSNQRALNHLEIESV